MKIIVVENACGYNKNGLHALNIVQDCHRMWLKADSALLTHGKPMFKPDFTEELSAAPYVVLRISRMGKSIPARFAHRYYDAVSVAVDFTAEDVLRQLRCTGEPWDLAKSFDGSVCMGTWRELGCAEGESGLSVKLIIDGTERSAMEIKSLNAEAGDVIERVSRLFTLRQGDILLVGNPQEKPLVYVDNHVECTLNGQTLTEFNIK